MPRGYTLTYGRFPCPVCDKVYSTLQALAGHKRVHPELVDSPVGRKKRGRLPKKHVSLVENRDEVSLRLFCSSCGHSYSSSDRSGLHRHVREEHRRRPDASELAPIRAVWDDARVEWRADA